MSTALILLAAGQGTRMKSELPKVLHKVAGAPLLIHAMRAGENIAAEKTVVVVGHGGPEVQAAALAYNEDAACVEQAERLGTAHSVAQARPVLDGFDGDGPQSGLGSERVAADRRQAVLFEPVGPVGRQHRRAALVVDDACRLIIRAVA